MKQIIAQFVEVGMNDNIVQYITDSMANSMTISINYKDSGWRTVQPYGWYNSKDNNMLVMCYKSDGAIRSYRLDRIYNLYVDDAIVHPEKIQDEDNNNAPTQSQFIIPKLPNIQHIMDETEAETGSEEPFSEATEEITNALKDNINYVENYQQEQAMNDISFDDTDDFNLDNSLDEDSSDDLDNEEDFSDDFDFDLDDSVDNQETLDNKDTSQNDFDFDLDESDEE